MLLTSREIPSDPLASHCRHQEQKTDRFEKETPEELLRTAGIPAQYFCRRSFATWDVLVLSQDIAKNCINTKLFQLQSEYTGTRRIRVIKTS